MWRWLRKDPVVRCHVAGTIFRDFKNRGAEIPSVPPRVNASFADGFNRERENGIRTAAEAASGW
jgi:hypothetical protein